MTDETFDQIKARIMKHWDEIQQIAETVPSTIEVRMLLSKVGVPTDLFSIGLTTKDITKALAYAQYTRPSFTL